jgi:phosphotransferase system HPr (HPr) family protein
MQVLDPASSSRHRASSMGKLISRDVVIRNVQGMHIRPAELFTVLAKKFESKIEVVNGDRRVDGKSLIDIFTLGAGQGTKLVLEAEGPDAEAACEALAELVESGFLNEDAENEKKQAEGK